MANQTVVEHSDQGLYYLSFVRHGFQAFSRNKILTVYSLVYSKGVL